MISPSLHACLSAFVLLSLLTIAQAQGAKKSSPGNAADADTDHVEQRAAWFLHGRVVPGKSSAELRHRAYQAKMLARAARLARAQSLNPNSLTQTSSATWTPLGPVPLASDATGDGFQNYNQVSGRATAVAIDPADPTGNTVYIGGAQGGVWKSINAATTTANNVAWTAFTDDQATLSIGAIAIQPGNTIPAQSVVLVGTGEADNSADSYFGLGILRTADGGNTWMLITTANSGTYSFAGLGATRMAFSAASPNTVVAAMAATNEGVTDGALTGDTYRGLYTSTDAGQTWSYNTLFSGAAEATSATSVVYNAAAGLFFAAIRYHGFYSSPDGLNWTYLANQPGGGILNPTACPQNYSTACPIYRGEITVVPGRNEMYLWFVSLDSNNEPVDQGIWLSTNSGATWTEINDGAITNCGDFEGCGVDQAFYNLELLAVPDGAVATDLYAGAINLYKCTIASPTSSSPSCGSPFMNLTHVYGCDPLSALAHVHPDQHAAAFTLLSSGADLMYFANDGGIYRALDGFTDLTTGSCSGSNLFDDLNQNLGSMTQFVGFSQSATNSNTILGGTQDNGSPATATATTNLSWGNVLGGDGGYNAIDPNTANFFASQPDVGGGTLGVQECSSGVNCNNSLFNFVVTSADVGGDDGAFYFPYILDPQSTSTLIVGTCRVWSGPRAGGAFTELSLNFDTLGVGTCSGDEINLVRAIAAGGSTNSVGSQVIYATTDGLGPNDLTTPIGGNVWVTTDATAISGVSSTFTNVTMNGPSAASVNPNQFPISSVAIDTSDPTANTAYVGIMGFTGGPGHIWQTTNAGASWTDFTGAGTNALPDNPVNAVLVDPNAHIIYAGTDVGVFESPTSAPDWTEVGPSPGSGQSGFLPNVAVTALALFNSGGQKLLRASTYGRGVWQFNAANTPDFEVVVPNSLLIAFPGTTPTFNGTATALDGYNSPVTLTCIAGSTTPPSPCTPSPATLTPTANGAPLSISVGAGTAITNYNFNLQAAGSDPNKTTHLAALTLDVVNFGVTAPAPNPINEPRGATSIPVSFQVTAQGSFNQSVTLSCTFSPAITGATCAFTPSATVNPTQSAPVPMTATVTVPAGTATGSYTVTLEASTAGAPAPVTASFTMNVITNPIFVLTEPSPFPNVKEGSPGTSGPITISSQDGFSGTVSLNCSNPYGANSCSVSPDTVSTFPSTVNMIINGTSFQPGSYQITFQGTSGSLTESLPVPFNVGDYTLTGPSTLSAAPGAQAQASLTFTSTYSYSGQVSASCAVPSLSGAQCTIAPNPVTINSNSSAPATATITVPNNAAAGAYNVNITSQDVTGEPTNSLIIPLTVTQDFSMGSVTPTSQTITAGQSATYNFNVSPVGSSFTNPVTLSCSNIPSSAQCAFSPNPVTPENSAAAVTLTISTASASAAGTYSVLVTGTSGSLSHSTSTSLTVQTGSTNNFQLAITGPFSTTAVAASQQTATVSVTPNYTGSLNATCTSTIPAGLCSVSPNPLLFTAGATKSLTLTVWVSNSAAPNPTNNYKVTLTVTDSSGQPTQNLSLPITVVQDYSLANFSPPSQTISAGGSATYNFSVLSVGAGYTNSVTLSCSMAPPMSGSCSFSPNPVPPLTAATPGSVVLTVTTNSGSSQMWRPRSGSGPWLYAVWLFLPALVCVAASKRHKMIAARLGMALIILFLITSCGGGGSNGGTSPTGPGGATLPATYTITVIGKPASISQAPGSATVTLTVQ